MPIGLMDAPCTPNVTPPGPMFTSWPRTPLDSFPGLLESPSTPTLIWVPLMLAAEPCTPNPPSKDVLAAIPLTLAVFVENVPVPLMLVTLKLPVASRLTIAFAVSLLAGGTFQDNPNVPAPVTGEPLMVKSDAGAVTPTLVTVPVPPFAHTHVVPFHCNICLVAHVLSRLRPSVPLVPPPVSPLPLAVVTPVMVPAPGNVCPVAKVKSPLLLSFNPVSVGVAVPEPNSRFSVPDGVVVLLPAASAFHWKAWLMAAWVLLLNDEATRLYACED